METISQFAPDPQTFWDLVKSRFIIPTKIEKKICAFWFTTVFWDKYKMKPYWGEWEERLGAIASDLATDYHWLDKREKFHEKVFGDISRYWKLFDIGTVVKESGTNFGETSNQKKDYGTSQSGKRISGKNVPAESVDLPQSIYGGHDRASFLATELGIQSGIRTRDPDDPSGKRWILRPDYSNTVSSGRASDKDHSHLTRNIKTKQQPNQKVSQILRLFKMVEYDVNSILKGYSYHFHGFSYPQGRLIPDPYTGFFKYKTRYEIEAELPEAAKKAAVADEAFKPLPKASWEDKFYRGEEVEEKHILENLKLYQIFLEKQATKMSGQNREMIERCINCIKNMREGYERPLNWRNVKDYDDEMNSVKGFEEFKRALRMRYLGIKQAAIDGIEVEQVFYNLTGEPGVGKTLIVQTYSRATQRPMLQVDYAGQNHPKVIDGISQSYKGAEIGKILEAFCQSRATMNITLEALEDELKMLNELPNVKNNKTTERQKERIEKLAEQIKKMKDSGQKEILEDRFSCSPIILLDEYEKCKDQATKDTVGKISDPNANWRFTDLFLNFAFDLSQMQLFVTVNDAWRVPGFVNSRFTKVHIDLQTYAIRLEIAKQTLFFNILRYFAAKDGEGGYTYPSGHSQAGQAMLGRDINKQLKKEKKLLPRQQKILDLIDEDFLKWCIDEQWGVRGVRQNVEKVIFWLYTLKLMKENESNPSSSSIFDLFLNRGKGLSQADQYQAKFEPNGNGVLTLTYNVGGQNWQFDIDYKRDIREQVDPETNLKTGWIDTCYRILKDWPREENIPSWWKDGGWKVPAEKKESVKPSK